MPQNHKKRSTALQTVLFITFLGVFIVSLSVLLKYFYDDYRSGQLNSQLASMVNSAEETPVSSEAAVLPKFEALLQQNPYTVGWIRIADTPIDYPVIQYTDNDYYLRRDFYGEDDRNGTIFIDYRNELNEPRENLLIYGHNMKSTKMFSSLVKYEKLNYYRQHPIIEFDQLTEEADYKIFAIVLADSSSNKDAEDLRIFLDFPSDESLMNYVQQTRECSFIDIPVDVRADDSIITLVTCAYDFEDARILIFARKVREGETSEVDVDQAKMNEDVKMPAAFVG